MWQIPQHRRGRRDWPRNYRAIIRFALLFCTAVLVAPPLVSVADISVQDGGTIAKPGSATVILGGSVRIPLQAILPSSTQTVKFRISVEPEFGRVSEIEPNHADTSRAWVTYTPKPDARPGTDVFSYNVKQEGKNASPSAKITVMLENPLPVLRVNPVLPFGKVEVGTVKRLPLRISNDGTKVYRTNLKPPVPWSIPDAQREVVIEPGEAVDVDVLFSPKDLKSAKFILVLQSDNPEGSVQFSGSGSSPFGKPYGTLDLTWDEASGKRRESFRLANLTDRRLPLKLSAPPQLQIVPVIELEPNEAVDVPVSLGGIEEFRGKLVIISEHHREEMPFSARATPAEIRVIEPQEREFRFELMDTETPPVYEITVTNDGGRKAFIYGETSRPFYTGEGGDPTELASGKQMKITVSMDPREIGAFERKLTILGTANKIEFQLSALITRNVDRTKVGVNLPQLAPLISAQEAKFLTVRPDYKTMLFGKNHKKRVTLAAIPTVKKIYLDEQSKRKLVFSWDHPGSSNLDYVLEYEVYKEEEGALPQAIWYRASDEHVKVEKDDKIARMTLKKLKPGRQFRIRILTMNKDGHTSKPSRTELVFTLPRDRKPLLLLVPFFLIAGGGGFYVWRRRQQV